MSQLVLTLHCNVQCMNTTTHSYASKTSDNMIRN